MLNRILIIVGFFSVSFVGAEQQLDTDLMAKALDGDITARLTIAKVFNDPTHSMYYPKKAIEMYVKLAREGEFAAFEPLAEAYSVPSSDFYDPGRSVTYLKRLPLIPNGQLLLNEVLSYRVPLTRINAEMVIRQIGNNDPYFSLLKALSYFPFDSASSAQRNSLIEAVNLPVTEPYRAYIYPSLVLPVVANTHLLKVAKASLERTTLSDMSWYQDEYTNRWYPVSASQGVKWVKFSVEPDEWRGQRLVGIVVAYPISAFTTLHDYYAGMMTIAEDGFRLPGVYLRLRDMGDIAIAEFVFTAVRPLLKPSRLPEDPAKKKAIPRMIFSSTIKAGE